GDENFIILNVGDMHEGIAGIVAGKIKDRYSRPAIIVTPSDEVGRGDGNVSLLKGTGRSIDGVNIYEVLNGCSDLFIRFGGHSKACGFLMEAGNLDRLTESVNRDIERQLEANPDLFARRIDIDAEIRPENVTVELARELMKMAPFGEGNPEPVLRMKDVDIRNLSYMGAEYNHARFGACEGSAYAPCVLFRRAQDLKPLLEGGGRVDITGSVSYQVWKGQERVQFIVEDIDRV
ncbi:MAG: DHHA1 domain-containing protein, partial [Bacillota bacterium]